MVVGHHISVPKVKVKEHFGLFCSTESWNYDQKSSENGAPLYYTDMLVLKALILLPSRLLQPTQSECKENNLFHDYFCDSLRENSPYISHIKTKSVPFHPVLKVLN